ncbi:hypothetical protein TcCL_ESM02976, partial [Trypanosoma cruzi]|uniref:C2H2-type domain-containing protein n=1 Tax=Trypanosoma cruzi (strain CL Brener) TaxID=353153 RepID=Q4D2B8_TRYCC|eukprot:XP_808515.1 hypothetical protein [Trypanosoma cruzi strain CL Brener]
MVRRTAGTSRDTAQQRQGGRRGSGGRETRTSSSERPTLRCPECLNVFLTWSRLTVHLNASAHFSARRVSCDEQLRCYGPTHPHRHEAATGHSGFFGIFYIRGDYRLDHPPVLSHPQYRCVCRVTFMSSLQIALHLRADHGVTEIPDEAVCLTCNIRGTLADLAKHRLERLMIKEDDVFEVPGFSPAPYLVRWPRLPPWPLQVRPYAVLYQCPICIKVFSSWAAMENHITSNGICQCMLNPVGVHPGNRPRGAEGQSFLPEEFEVLLDTSEPEMLSLIQGYSPESGGPAQEDGLLLAFQCPEETCSRLFLTHGELLEHMEQETHFPIEQEEQAEGAARNRQSWKWNISAYEVMCSARRLVEDFGFSSCPVCRRVLARGTEVYHQQLFHPTAQPSLPPPSTTTDPTNTMTTTTTTYGATETNP